MNGYTARYKNRSVKVYAVSNRQAQLAAARYWHTKKPVSLQPLRMVKG